MPFFLVVLDLSVREMEEGGGRNELEIIVRYRETTMEIADGKGIFIVMRKIIVEYLKRHIFSSC